MLRRIFAFSLVLLGLCVAGRQPARAQSALDWNALGREGTEYLSRLLQFDTTNPPGNELAAAQYLKSILDREGIPAEVIETAPARGVVIARLSAEPPSAPDQALLLLAHLDVVGVDRAKWEVDPFGGVTKEGELYGRGALDDKGQVIANLMAMLAIKRSGVPVKRDIIFFAEGDEESGGDLGMLYTAQKHWEKIRAGYAINEGGRVVARPDPAKRAAAGGVATIGVQNSEKLSYAVEVIATGPSGHASMPLVGNPVVHLAAAVARLAAYQAPAELNTTTRRYFEQLAKIEDPETAKWMRLLEDPMRGAEAARRLSENPAWNSMLRNTVSPTILRAGLRVNVIPSEARATLNIRLLPGKDIGTFVQELEKVVADPQVKLQAQAISQSDAPSSPFDTPLFTAIEKASAKVFPGAVITPYMSTWGTDSVELRLKGVVAYGLLPFPLTDQQIAGYHADNERIPLDSFREGCRYLFEIVREFVSSP
ncbi:MAG TPA: M20/M25/M40 family metallo-hydrolase [Candidatus Acidoferrales bacterium]